MTIGWIFEIGLCENYAKVKAGVRIMERNGFAKGPFKQKSRDFFFSRRSSVLKSITAIFSHGASLLLRSSVAKNTLTRSTYSSSLLCPAFLEGFVKQQ